MPHKCVRCARVYPNNSPQLLKGCECGARVFVFLKDEQVTLKEMADNKLEVGEKMEFKPADKAVDVSQLGWLEDELASLAKDKPVSVDYDAVENLRILGQGQYELDIVSLMKGEPLIVKTDKQIYYIKLPSVKKAEKKK